MEKKTPINRFATQHKMGIALSAEIARLAAQASTEKGRFFLALSGGSLLDALCPNLTAPSLRNRMKWSDWHVFWADERWVPPESPESNYGVARKRLLDAVDIPAAQIHAADSAVQSPSETARKYQSAMKTAFQTKPDELPCFDLILLGIGEDGHTASLFPNHPLLEETERWVVPVHDAPKPPPLRISLTLPVINNARNVFFVAAGSRKKEIITRILDPEDKKPKLPAQRVRPSNGKLAWYISDGDYR